MKSLCINVDLHDPFECIQTRRHYGHRYRTATAPPLRESERERETASNIQYKFNNEFMGRLGLIPSSLT